MELFVKMEDLLTFGPVGALVLICTPAVTVKKVSFETTLNTLERMWFAYKGNKLLNNYSE